MTQKSSHFISVSRLTIARNVRLTLYLTWFQWRWSSSFRPIMVLVLAKKLAKSDCVLGSTLEPISLIETEDGIRFPSYLNSTGHAENLVQNVRSCVRKQDNKKKMVKATPGDIASWEPRRENQFRGSDLCPCESSSNDTEKMRNVPGGYSEEDHHHYSMSIPRSCSVKNTTWTSH